MDFPRTSAQAAKQILDSTRVFKEYVKVCKDAQQFTGSLFWKKVGSYEYLAHKREGKLTYLSARSPETEQRFEQFKLQKSKFGERLRTLKSSVASCERMNKAVRAGAVPKPVVAVLKALDKLGLAQQSVVLGAAALYAYGQPAGVRLEELKRPHGSGKLVEDADHHLHILVQGTETLLAAAVVTLREAAHAKLDTFHAGGSTERSHYLLTFTFAHKRKLANSSATTPGQDRFWQVLAMAGAADAQAAAQYEQVVIGKTGAMATMRTLDPQFFAMCTHAVAKARSTAASQDAEWQAAVVDSLIDEYLVVPKLDASECEQTVRSLAQRVTAQD